MDSGLIGNIASIIGIAVSLIIAAVQTVRIKELRRRTNSDLWFSLMIATSINSKLTTAKKNSPNQHLLEAKGKSVELFRHLLKQVVLEEKNFSEETILKWKSVGKLGTDWQLNQARRFLATEAISAERSYVLNDDIDDEDNSAP